ncbi:MAG: hypothetical protein AAF692_00885 [Pseudomonadota bacterium]
MAQRAFEHQLFAELTARRNSLNPNDWQGINAINREFDSRMAKWRSDWNKSCGSKQGGGAAAQEM